MKCYRGYDIPNSVEYAVSIEMFDWCTEKFGSSLVVITFNCYIGLYISTVKRIILGSC